MRHPHYYVKGGIIIPQNLKAATYLRVALVRWRKFLLIFLGVPVVLSLSFFKSFKKENPSSLKTV